MKNIFSIFICCYIYSGLCFSGDQYIFQITDKMSIKSLTGAELTWDPSVIDRLELEKQVKEYLRNKMDTKSLDYVGQDTKILCNYINENISKYNIEYAGIIKDAKRLVYINMFIGDRSSSDRNSFTLILDGGCSVIRIIYSPVTDEIMSLFCNGVA